jgi:hypothetical protein
MLAALGAIFGWAFFSFWSAIPAGLALTVPPVLVVLTVTISYGAGALVVVLVGAPLRQRIRARMTTEGEPTRFVRWALSAWDRFGLVGLALLAPMTVGSQVAAVIGLTFDESPLRLVIALTLGAGLWAVGLTAAITVGLIAVT